MVGQKSRVVGLTSLRETEGMFGLEKKMRGKKGNRKNTEGMKISEENKKIE